ncbi:hypothetical protein M3I54_28095 [Paraburkholderia sp. CNPSo 3274]|uniref:hypothetical protein n=1 Tax=Paraburkholderia sp. CNPSo 3274 TaxID=2940932 RepID=UPI0020B6F3F6|nr:hypothetical protein [Paraburkholderia sp. CNPSo 3274]MCP3710790.1 hypothetical protein [Paraburkholderia sp. CNPSo 3274]
MREVINASPVAVVYSIIELGRTLQVPIGAVYAWSIRHLDEIEHARNTYDQREGR